MASSWKVTAVRFELLRREEGVAEVVAATSLPDRNNA